MSAASVSGGKIEIRLGNIDGQLLGVCNINSTGGAEIWQTFTTQVKKLKAYTISILFSKEVKVNCSTWTTGSLNNNYIRMLRGSKLC